MRAFTRSEFITRPKFTTRPELITRPVTTRSEFMIRLNNCSACHVVIKKNKELNWELATKLTCIDQQKPYILVTYMNN